MPTPTTARDRPRSSARRPSPARTRLRQSPSAPSTPRPRDRPFSGSAYAVFGWALTPQPAIIPTDGSTIWVYVDGTPLGHPTYNLYRSDIATLFSGYANTGGAVVHFVLDTTTLANGLHSIAWSVTDDLARLDGIGSRYFWVQN